MLLKKNLGEATFREIHNQAVSCQETIDRAPERLDQCRELLPIEQYSDIILTGCGSSYNLAQCGAFAWTMLTGRAIYAVPASELMHFSGRYLQAGARPLIIAISRTGGTTEVKLAVQTIERNFRSRSLALTMRPGSDVGSVCDVEIALPESYEESVVMTQAFASFLTAIYLLGDGATGDRYKGEIGAIPRLIEEGINSNEPIISRLAADLDIDRFVFLGSGPMKGLADESALKMTEMALCASSSFHVLEFRHGPIAALDKTGMVVIFPVEAELPYLPNLLQDILLTKASVLVAGTALTAKSIESLADNGRCRFIGSPDDIPEFLRPPAFAYVGHLLGYWRSNTAQLDPDLPRNLERTVLLGA